MMNLGSITLRFVVPIVLLVSAGCASPPPPRESPEAAVIGASIKRAGRQASDPGRRILQGSK